ncbi:hypothetical protein UFOVP1138_37 [uncultured Caudovirales phage]|uniref:Uncharacterized protein n=1 Tax=uncultured Caudovirales phage TaxID=2100421 RepID=A0A6J5PZB2_9CAUD|nr:hypothetical protein UFOVP975_84 [uncultured Caudovirales phage]CAB4186243.1 hypothetical protein UFOVP1138_37 [uncultured Caudovirales phage]CAB4204414.1 hypothetical protein UFOVP1394_34 [uncultured Caudovirales phage]
MIHKPTKKQEESVLSLTFEGMNNVLDTSSIGNDPKQASVLQNVDTMMDGSIRRRKGQQLIVSGNFHSGWTGMSSSYVVHETSLKSFNGTNLSSSMAIVAAKLPMSFCQVGDIVVFSNGVDFGVIENGVVQIPFAPTAQFKERMQPGQFLEFYNGRLYSFYNETLYCSDSLDSGGGVEQMDSRQNIVGVFDTRGTMLKAVDDGLWVGTETETAFLYGNDAISAGGNSYTTETGFKFMPIAPYGVCFGSAVQIKGELLSVKGKIVLWASKRGICVGGDGGEFVNKSQGIISYDYGDAAAMVREQNGLVHYVCSMNTTETAYNQFEGTGITPE